MAIDVNQPDRVTRGKRNKTDAVDAESAARAVLSGRSAGLGFGSERPDQGDQQAALKVLYLAVRNLEEIRGRNVGIRSSGCHHQSRD
jgi:hypothetical protein